MINNFPSALSSVLSCLKKNTQAVKCTKFCSNLCFMSVNFKFLVFILMKNQGVEKLF